MSDCVFNIISRLESKIESVDHGNPNELNKRRKTEKKIENQIKWEKKFISKKLSIFIPTSWWIKKEEDWRRLFSTISTKLTI